MKNLLLNFSHQGQGEPLIIIHGLFGSSRNWKSLAKRFAEHYQVILIDLRNHGHSPFDSNMNYQLMVNDVFLVMQQLGIDSAHVLGHSMGGKVAMKLAQLHPGSVRSLVIADIAPLAYQHDYADILNAVIKLDLAQISSRHAADKALAKGIPDQRIRLFLLQNIVISAGKASWNINWQALNNNMSIITGYENIEHWQISSPSLFLRGEESTYINQQAVELIKRHFNKVEFVTLENAGHWLHAEQPEAFYQAVFNFLNA